MNSISSSSKKWEVQFFLKKKQAIITLIEKLEIDLQSFSLMHM